MTKVRYTVVIEREVGVGDYSDLHGGSGKTAAILMEEEIEHGLSLLDVAPVGIKVVRRFINTENQWELSELPVHFEDDPIETVIVEIDTDDETVVH